MADAILGVDLKGMTVEFLRTPPMESLLAPLRGAVVEYFPGVAKDDLNFLIFIAHIPIALLILSVLYFGVVLRFDDSSKKRKPAPQPASTDAPVNASKETAAPVDAAAGVNLTRVSKSAPPAESPAAPTPEPASATPPPAPTPAPAAESATAQVPATTPARRPGRPKKVVDAAAIPAATAVSSAPSLSEAEAESESSLASTGSYTDRPRRQRRETQHFSPSRTEEGATAAKTTTKPAARKRAAK